MRPGNSVFSRLVLVFLFIMIPIYILGIYIYQWGLGTLKNEISQSAVSQASFYLESLEDEIERIKILQYDCLNDENLNKLAIRWEIMDQYDINEAIRQLQQRLVSIHNSSEYIKDVSAHVFPIQRSISSTRGIAEFNKEKYLSIRAGKDNLGAQIISYKQGLYLSTLQEESIAPNYPFYLIEIELEPQALRQALDQFETYEDSGSYLVSLTESNVIIYRSESDTIFADKVMSGYTEAGPYGIQTYELNGREYYIVQAESEYLGMALVRYFPAEFILNPLNNFYIWVWTFSISAILLIVFYSYYVYRLMYKPMNELVNQFKLVERGNLQVSIDHDVKNEFGYLYRGFNEMTRKLSVLIDQVYNQKILMQRAELKQMQSQINPHFLYNSFFMLNTMVRVNDENLMAFTKYLGEYFRYITRNSSDYVPLIDEINHAKVYANIQLIRFPRRFRAEFEDCPVEYEKFSVPRLIMQPIIENAFEHGIGKRSIDGLIALKYETGKELLKIIIEDNGDELTDKELEILKDELESSGDDIEITGIINIHRRIRLIYGEQSGVTVSRSPLGGLRVTITIAHGGDGHL